MSDFSAIVGFGLLFGGLTFAAFRAFNDAHTKSMVSAEVKAREYVAEAKVRAMEAEMAAMKRIAAAEAVALDRIKSAMGNEKQKAEAVEMTPASEGVFPSAPAWNESGAQVSASGHEGGAAVAQAQPAQPAESDPSLTPDPDQDGIDENHVRMMDGFVYPKSDFQTP